MMLPVPRQCGAFPFTGGLSMTKPNPQQQSPQNAPSSLPTSAQNALTAPDFITPDVAGAGVSRRPEDQQRFVLGIAENNSLVADKLAPEHLNGCTSGCLYIRDFYPECVFAGEEGIDVIATNMERVLTEWLPGRQRQAPVGRHLTRPADVTMQITQENGRDKLAMVRSCGTVLQETVEINLLFRGQPVLFPCWSTRIIEARRWNTYASHLHDDKGNVLPLFARVYRIRTQRRTRNNQSWYTFRAEDRGFASRENYFLARELHEAVKRGDLRANFAGIEAA
jgi:hypothetical protein